MTLAELYRLLINMLRQGVVTEVDTKNKVCRVQSGELVTDWIRWTALRAGTSRSWWAPSVGEQVLIGAIGGELTTAFVIGSLYSDKYDAPSYSDDALHYRFSDGAVLEYEPATGALKATGIKTATLEASEEINATSPKVIVNANVQINLNTPTVICSDNLTCSTLNVKKGGAMTGNIQHSGGDFSSNGVVVHKHTHGGVRGGTDSSGEPN